MNEVTRPQVIRLFNALETMAEEWHDICLDGAPDGIDLAIAFGELRALAHTGTYLLHQTPEQTSDGTDIPF